MCGGGSSGNVTQTQKFEAPSYTTDGSGGATWTDFLNTATNNANRPYTPYEGMRIAPINDVQNSASDMFIDRGMNGDPYGNSSRAYGLDQMQGKFMGQGPQANVQGGTNPLAGSNAWLNQTIGDNADNMANSFAMGTAANNDAASNMHNAFGGSGWALKQSADAAGLAKSVGQMANTARFQDFGNQQNMQEAALGRNLNANEFNTTQNMGQYNTDVNRMQDAMHMAPQFAQDDRTDISNMMTAGNMQNDYTQKLLGQNYDDFTQMMNYPINQTNMIGDALSRASGTGGSSSASMPGASPWASILGGLGLGLGVYNSGLFKT